MIRKYAAFIGLLLAAALLFYVKQHQRGPVENITVQPLAPAAETQLQETVNRHPAQIIYTRHARCRMECRHITEAEIKQVIENGSINERKIESDERGKTYPLEATVNNRKLRIVVAPKQAALVIVTVIDLDTDWPCDCH